MSCSRNHQRLSVSPGILYITTTKAKLMSSHSSTSTNPFFSLALHNSGPSSLLFKQTLKCLTTCTMKHRKGFFVFLTLLLCSSRIWPICYFPLYVLFPPHLTGMKLTDLWIMFILLKNEWFNFNPPRFIHDKFQKGMYILW